VNVKRIAYPIIETPRSFNCSSIFKKGGTLSIMNSFKLKGCNRLSKLVSLDFNHKGLRANPFEEV